MIVAIFFVLPASLHTPHWSGSLVTTHFEKLAQAYHLQVYEKIFQYEYNVLTYTKITRLYCLHPIRQMLLMQGSFISVNKIHTSNSKIPIRLTTLLFIHSTLWKSYRPIRQFRYGIWICICITINTDNSICLIGKMKRRRKRPDCSPALCSHRLTTSDKEILGSLEWDFPYVSIKPCPSHAPVQWQYRTCWKRST